MEIITVENKKYILIYRLSISILNYFSIEQIKKKYEADAVLRNDRIGELWVCDEIINAEFVEINKELSNESSTNH